MNQSKGLTPVIVCTGIIAAVYLVVAFAVPFLWTTSYWVAFGFGWLALAITVVANVYMVNSSQTSKGVLYRSSMSVISITYLIIAAVLTLVFMALGFVPIWIIVVVQVVLAAVCVAFLVMSEQTASHIEAGEAATAYSTSFIKSLRAEVDSFVPMTMTPEAAQAVTALADKLSYTDPVSHPALAAVNQEIASLVSMVREALIAHDDQAVVALCDQASRAVERRAAIAITLK